MAEPRARRRPPATYHHSPDQKYPAPGAHLAPRLTFLFHGRLSEIAFGLLVIGGSAAAFFAPPFTGLDTVPALGVVLLSLGVLFEDFLLASAGVAVGMAGVLLEIVVGAAAVHGLRTIP